MPDDERDAEDDHYMEAWEEYRQDAAREKFYEELYEENIKYFATSRLQAFYRTHPLVIQAPLAALHEARSLALQYHPSAALVFAVAATEVCFNEALLKPIFYGLVHTESSAAFLMDLAIAPQAEKFVKTMHKILANHGGVNLHSFKRSGVAQTLWEEKKHLEKRRNKVVHRCEIASPNEAARAIGVAAAMIEEIFPTTIAHLGLHLHQGLQVCDGMNCPDLEI